MILSFKKQFKEPILNGTKKHTIREDKPNRWKAGNNIHAATGVRTKQFNCFFSGKCISTQEIEIKHFSDLIEVSIKAPKESKNLGKTGTVRKNKRGEIFEYPGFVYQLAINDGFKDLESFFTWFSEDYKGKIIHWTDLTY